MLSQIKCKGSILFQFVTKKEATNLSKNIQTKGNETYFQCTHIWPNIQLETICFFVVFPMNALHWITHILPFPAHVLCPIPNLYSLFTKQADRPPSRDGYALSELNTVPSKIRWPNHDAMEYYIWEFATWSWLNNKLFMMLFPRPKKKPFYHLLRSLPQCVIITSSLYMYIYTCMH